MKEREGHEVTLEIQEFVDEDLDELSAADLKIVDETWKKFGFMDEWDLSRYTHEHCAEAGSTLVGSRYRSWSGRFSARLGGAVRMPSSRNSVSRNNERSSVCSVMRSIRAQRMDPAHTLGTE